MTRPIIVLDPGHGGFQPAGGSSPNNAHGPNGLQEKDLTLDLARRAAGLLAADMDVVLTRSGDSNLGLAERARIARDRRADVFLSIHLNGFTDPSVDGTEAWTARSPSRASQGLARLVLEQLLAVTGVKNRGVREKNFGVLLAARHAPNTAASLAEIAFLSNPAQARRLEDDGYRQRIAKALAEGVRQSLRRSSKAMGAGHAEALAATAVTPIIVESDPSKRGAWMDYLTEYKRETSKTKELDLEGLGTPEIVSGETLEEVLDLMGKMPGRIALIYGHATSSGLLMRITKDANSAESRYLRGISRAWKAVHEIIRLRSGKWPASEPDKPKFLIDVPAAIELFEKLLRELRQLDGELAGRLADPSTVKNRTQADAWFDQWIDLMAKACLGRGLGETDLRRVCRAMQKVRDARFERIEIRGCDLGKRRENLDALREFLQAGLVVAPKVTVFFGKAAVNLPRPGQRGDLDQLAQDIGGFRGDRLTAPGVSTHPSNVIRGGEPELAAGERNRIFPPHGPVDAILQMTETGAFHYEGRLFVRTRTDVTQFLQAYYKADYTLRAGMTDLPVGGLWTAGAPDAKLPFILPLEPEYRDLLVTSPARRIAHELAQPGAPHPEPVVYQGQAFTPVNDPTIFRCAPIPAAVTSATLLPSETADPDAAIGQALRAVGLSAQQTTTFEKAKGFPGLRPFAEVFGAPALAELMKRLRYTPDQIVSPPHNRLVDPKKGINELRDKLKLSRHAEILPARLLMAIPGHFRELARRAPDEREAYTLETFGWLLMESMVGRVAKSTQRTWWTPKRPPFVAPLTPHLPKLSTQVRQMIQSANLIDRGPSPQNPLAGFTTWSQGPAGRQWRLETGRESSDEGPGRPFYREVTTIVPPFDIREKTKPFIDAWQTGSKPPAKLKLASLKDLKLLKAFPHFAATAEVYDSLLVLEDLVPQFELVFETLYRLGWGDLVFQSSGAFVFRGNTSNPKELSEHGSGTAVDLMFFENPRGKGAIGSMDPRVVALFEAFHFKWGRCFKTPDTHHFEYCGRICYPAAKPGKTLETDLAAAIGGLGFLALDATPPLARSVAPQMRETAERVRGIATAPTPAPATRLPAGRAEIDCPVLNSHGTKTRNAILRWNAPPPSPAEIDVLVHLHGFQSGPLDLRAKEALSGCDFSAPGGSPARSRFTLGIIPRGKQKDKDEKHKYDFPALTDAEPGLDQLIACALDRFATGTLGQPAGSLKRKRLILTAHSGGGFRLNQLLRHKNPDEVHFYDALYATPTQALRWAAQRIQADAAALGFRPPSEWPAYMRTSGGSLRAVFNANDLTTPHNTALHTGIECALQAISSSALRDFLRRYYRVERTAKGHNEIPPLFGWQLLVDASADLNPAPVALAKPVKCPSIAKGLAEDDYDDGFGPEAFALEKLGICPRVQPPCIPARPAGADKGKAFMKDRIMNLRGPKREKLILAELLQGNIPDFLRRLKPVTVKLNDTEILYQVMPDYLSIGDDSDWVRIPINAITAQKVADKYCMMIPTAKMAEDIYQNADIQLVGIARPYYLGKTPVERAKQVATEAYLEHHEAIDKDLKTNPSYSQGVLVAGHKKDVVLADRLWTEKKLAFYGLYKNGKPTEAYFKDKERKQLVPGKASLAHEPTFSDYSQGVRLVSREVVVAGQTRDLAEILKDEKLYPLVYNELTGAMKKPARIPGV